jgi:hypothetical protein
VSVLPADVRPPEPPHRARLLRFLALGVALAFVAGLALTFAGGSGSSTSGNASRRLPAAQSSPTKSPAPSRTPAPTRKPAATPTAAPSPTREADWDGRRSDLGYLATVFGRGPEGARVQFDRAELRDGRVVNRGSRLREMLIAPGAQILGRRRLADSETPRPMTLDALIAAVETSERKALLRFGYDRYGRVVRIEER